MPLEQNLLALSIKAAKARATFDIAQESEKIREQAAIKHFTDSGYTLHYQGKGDVDLIFKNAEGKLVVVEAKGGVSLGGSSSLEISELGQATISTFGL